VSTGAKYGPAAALAVLVAASAAAVPRFASLDTLRVIALQAVPVVLVGVGMTLVIASRGIDLSVGSVMAVASAAAAALIGHGAGVAVLGGLAAAAALGSVNGVLIARGRAEPFIVTLALLLAGRGLAQVICHEGEVVPFADPLFEWLGKGRVGPLPVPVLLAVLAVAGGLFLARATTFGRYLAAVGGNEAAARLAGVPVVRTRLAVYVICALLAGVAGLVETARLGAADPSNLGGGMEFAAIFATVIGGTPLYGGRANVGGTVLGALILAVLGASFNMLLVPFAWSLAVQSAIILLAVYVQRTPAA
jgi:ribose/xylose/arabinose/galactoside ABC-type transport system permease subunit